MRPIVPAAVLAAALGLVAQVTGASAGTITIDDTTDNVKIVAGTPAPINGVIANCLGESCTASFSVAGPGMMVAAKTITFALTEGSGAGAAVSDLITVTAAAPGFGIFTNVDVSFTSDSDNGSGLTAPPGATTLGAEMADQTINLGTFFPAVGFPATIEVLNDLETGQTPEPSTLSIVAMALLVMGACGRPARSWLDWNLHRPAGSPRRERCMNGGRRAA